AEAEAPQPRQQHLGQVAGPAALQVVGVVDADEQVGRGQDRPVARRHASAASSVTSRTHRLCARWAPASLTVPRLSKSRTTWSSISAEVNVWAVPSSPTARSLPNRWTPAWLR